MKKLSLLVVLLLNACSLPRLVQWHTPVTPNNVTASAASSVAPDIAPATVLPTVTESTGEQNCSYTWAYQDLTELSAQVEAAIKALQPEASARARAFGEDCIYEDGNKTFLAMETDFYLTLQVDDLRPATLGDWIAKSMQALEQFPHDQTPGPQPGRVDFTFKAGGEERLLSVPIASYLQLSPDLHGADLFYILFPDT